jgi:hypothetical protein
MIKKYLIGVGIGCIMTTCLTAHATTADDVAAVARQYGLPESAIQQGYAKSESGTYTSDDYDYAIEYIEAYHDEILNRFTGDSGTSGNNTSTDNSTGTEETTTATETTTVPESTVGNNSSDNAAETGNNSSDISQKEFIDMSLEEKQAYVNSLPSDEQENFLNSLTADELKSIVKQLPIDDKAAVADKFVQAGEAMGINVTVDEISDSSVSMSLRNSDGEIIGVTNAGVIVEDTGRDYRKLFAVVGAAFMLAAAGIVFVIRKCFRKETDSIDEK